MTEAHAFQVGSLPLLLQPLSWTDQPGVILGRWPLCPVLMMLESMTAAPSSHWHSRLRGHKQGHRDQFLLHDFFCQATIKNVYVHSRMCVKEWGTVGFLGGAVVESLPAKAGDTGSSPGLGTSHMPRSN